MNSNCPGEVAPMRTIASFQALADLSVARWQSVSKDIPLICFVLPNMVFIPLLSLVQRLSTICFRMTIILPIFIILNAKCKITVSLGVMLTIHLKQTVAQADIVVGMQMPWLLLMHGFYNLRGKKVEAKGLIISPHWHRKRPSKDTTVASIVSKLEYQLNCQRILLAAIRPSVKLGTQLTIDCWFNNKGASVI